MSAQRFYSWLADNDSGDAAARLNARLELQSAGIISEAELRAWALGETLEEAEKAIARINAATAGNGQASPEIAALLDGGGEDGR